MRYLVVFALFIVFLVIMIARQDTPAPQPQQAKPVVIYRTVERPAAIDRESAANLKYLSDVAERNEFRRRWRQTYGTTCPQ